MSMYLDMGESLKDASDEELRDFILETLLELLDMATALTEKKKLSADRLH